MDPVKPVTGWVRVFHPCGIAVELPVQTCVEGKIDYRVSYQAIAGVLAAGFTRDPPGCGKGQQREKISHVIRMEKTNPDRSLTPMLGLYSAEANKKYRELIVYLDSEQQVAAFEQVAGASLDALPNYPGEIAPERDGGPKTAKFIVATPNQFYVVTDPHPKYDEAEAAACAERQDAYKIPKRKFARWEAIRPAGTPQIQPAQQPKQTPPAQQKAAEQPKQQATRPAEIDTVILADWRKLLQQAPDADRLSELVAGSDYVGMDPTTKQVVRKEIKEYADFNQFEFDTTTRKFVAPIEPDNVPAY